MTSRAAAFWQQHKAILKCGAVFLCAGLLYMILVLLTPIRIPCAFYQITGLYCPGCGVSRFFVEVFHGRFLSAISQNLAIAILLPIWGTVAVVEFLFDPPALHKDSKLTSALLWSTLIFLILFSIFRNLPAFSYLQPGGLLQEGIIYG